MWTQALLEHKPCSEILEGYALKDFIRDFQVALADDGIADLAGWTSHSIRRGSGTDVLYSRGVLHMLKHGEWGGLDSASFYASLDEMHAREVASRALDLSGDEHS